MQVFQAPAIRMLIVSLAALILAAGMTAGSLAQAGDRASPGSDAYARGAALLQEKRYAEARDALLSAAEAGISDAYVSLGDLYWYGRGVEKDYAQGAAWFLKAAQAGHPEGMRRTAGNYKNGWGVTQDIDMAIAWYRKAADAGVPDAFVYLGDAYLAGEGVATSATQAAQWYKGGVDAGSWLAARKLGRLYETGSGVAQDYSEAARLYAIDASRPGGGSVEASYYLGRLHARGLGAPRSAEKAKALLQRAVDHKNNQFADDAAKLISALSASEETDAEIDALTDETRRVAEDIAGIGNEAAEAAGELCLMAKPSTAQFCAPAALALAGQDDLGLAEQRRIRLNAIDALLKAGCAQDNGASCVSYLHPDIQANYSNEQIVASFQKGMAILGPACERSEAAQCKAFSDGLWWYRARAPLPGNFAKAMPASLKRSCDLGDINGCLALADALGEGTHGFPRNADAARNLRTQLCERDVSAACVANNAARSR